jgi:exopolyphosphatase/guanosine-5'-triphosphate,3'-diphosphate pyrophosphatase
MDSFGVSRGRLVATSAVRDAINGKAFLDAASRVVGVEAELLAGEEEGRLSYLGATSDLEPDGRLCLVLDIGGGSTEMVTGREGQLHSFSMDIGCVRLTERALPHDPPPPDEVAAAVALIQREIDHALRASPKLAEQIPGSRLIGLAGTVSTLAALELGLANYERERVHHAVLEREAVERWCRDLAQERAQDRAVRIGMLDGRQDVIVGGALVLREIMRRFHFVECLVSEADILDGLVQSLG